MTELDRGIERTRSALVRHIRGGFLTQAWQLELALWLGVEVPDEVMEDFMDFWQHSRATTPFPDGRGPWGAHPVWGEESYGIGHIHNLVELLRLDGLSLHGSGPLAEWVAGLQEPDGRFAAQEAFQALFRERHPEQAARRDGQTHDGWAFALPGATAPTLWAHSDLEDAFHALTVLDTLDHEPRDPGAAIRWLRGRQRGDGAFRSPLTVDALGEPYGDPLSDTMYAVRALAQLGAGPADRPECVSWLLDVGRFVGLGRNVIAWWRRLEALRALDAVARVREGLLDFWSAIEITPDPEADLVDFHAYAAVRGWRVLTGAA